MAFIAGEGLQAFGSTLVKAHELIMSTFVPTAVNLMIKL